MSIKNITDFEDQIAADNQAYEDGLNAMLLLSRNDTVSKNEIQDSFNAVSSKASKFFGKFSRSLTEYGLKRFEADENVKNSKINDSVSVLSGVLDFWLLARGLKGRFNISIPTPSTRAHSDIQLFLKTFDPDEAKKIQSKFEEAKLPVHGFTTTKTFKDVKNPLTKYGFIAGIGFLLLLVGIALFVDCPTSFQNKIFTTLLALAAAGFAASIEGLFNLKLSIGTAAGAAAFGVLVYLWNPAELSSFKSCQSDISGTIYYGGNPLSDVSLTLIKQSQKTKTDNNGNFRLPLDLSTVESDVKIYLKKEALQIDTTFSILSENLKKSLDIQLRKYCVSCFQTNAKGETINRQETCSASHRFVTDVVNSYKREVTNKNIKVTCSWR